MIRSILDAWNDPAMRHAMIIHFPIVLSVLGAPVLLAAAIRPRERAWRVAAVLVYGIMALAAYMASSSGDRAEHAVEGALSDAGAELLEEHEERGEWVWVIAAGVAALAGASFARPVIASRGAAWAAAAGGLFAAAWVAGTADRGGQLVYRHGAGTPGPRAAQAAPAGTTPADPSADPRLAFFREQVKPILVDNCLRCHNPTRLRRSGGLDQTSIAGLLTGGMSGPALVPGNPQESLLIQAVTWQDPDLKMPKGKEKLPDTAIQVLQKWIAEGAVWEPFQYQPPAPSP